MRKTFLAISFLFLLSCNYKGYEQSYADYSDFEKITNKRLTGWFPEIITRDSYKIKNTSYLDICAFSSVEYKKSSSLDSIFKSYKTVSVEEFKNTVKKYQSKVPEWFVSLDSVTEETHEAIELNNRLFGLRQKSGSRIYSISSIKYK